jgi:hypothetical protein
MPPLPAARCRWATALFCGGAVQLVAPFLGGAAIALSAGDGFTKRIIDALERAEVGEVLSTGVAAQHIEPVGDGAARSVFVATLAAGVMGSRAVEAPPAVAESVQLFDAEATLTRHVGGAIAPGVLALVLPLISLGALAGVGPRRLEARTCGY